MDNKFKIGDRVKLISTVYMDHKKNPFWGGKFGNVAGTVNGIDDGFFPLHVEWDNGCYNYYRDDDIELVADPIIKEIESLFDGIIKEMNVN